MRLWASAATGGSMSASKESIHSYPVDEGEHVTDGIGCWCVPRYYLPCDECGDVDGLDAIADNAGDTRLNAFAEDMHAAVPGCWKCVEGLVELTQAEAEACERPLVIVHNR
jgi:hypothetical protein